MADVLKAYTWLFDSDSDGLWKTYPSGLSGPPNALAFVPVSMYGTGPSQIVQLSDNAGQLALDLYGRVQQGLDVIYKNVWETTDLGGRSSSAPAFLPVTMNGDCRVQILQLRDDSGK